MKIHPIILIYILFTLFFSPVALAEELTIPFIVEGACPYEGCTFGMWKVLKDTPVYEKANIESKIVTLLSSQAMANVETGVLFVVPGKAKITGKPYKTASALNPEKLVFILDYIGEGYSRVYQDGKLYNTKIARNKERCTEIPNWRYCWVEILQEPIVNWWVKIKGLGWLSMDTTPLAPSFIEKKVAPPIESGVWLNSRYIEIVNETKSPQKASYGTYISYIEFDSQGNSLVIYNFHEGIRDGFKYTSIEPINKKGVYEISRTYPFGETKVIGILRRQPENRIDWENETFTHIKENDVETFVAKAVLAGEYKNIDGADISFTESGYVKMPRKSFSYTINLDYVLLDEVWCDTFVGEIESKDVSYGFRWEEKKLLIYNTHRCSGEPVYILTPIKK